MDDDEDEGSMLNKDSVSWQEIQTGEHSRVCCQLTLVCSGAAAQETESTIEGDNRWTSSAMWWRYNSGTCRRSFDCWSILT